MNEKGVVCPKCQGAMVRGFIPDYSYNAIFFATWCEGLPRRSWFRKIKAPKIKCVPIGAFRCASCGYLEAYARDEIGAT
jgi:hypothetical protein